MLQSEEHCRKQQVDPLYIRAIQEHSSGQIQPRFFSQQILKPCFAKELYLVGLMKYATAIEEEGLVPGGFEGNTGRQAVFIHLSTP